MLWGFFDKSAYHHADDGHIIQYTLGGCIAGQDRWDPFKKDWKAFLDRHSTGMFHATNYANVEKHKVELDEAVKIIQNNQLSCYGSTIFVPDEYRPPKPKQALQKFYEDCAVDMIWHAAQHANALNEDIALVFARFGDFSLDKIKKHFGDFQSVDRCLHSVGVGEPSNCLPLQAADFVAYEVQHYHRADISIGEARRPFTNLINAFES